MHWLIIGGTRFLGRHLVDAAQARGDRVTLFNRGQSLQAPPPGVEWRQGDRRADLGPLATGEWDAVVDTCGYLPGEVARMADLLHGRVGRYVFISSISAYAGSALPNDEDAPLATTDTPDTEVVDGSTYGPLKALCEAAATARFGDRALLIRPGLIVGPHDPTQRFTYWPARWGRAKPGEEVLAPGTPQAPIQYIDVRDLAAFVLRAACEGRQGAFNAVCPPGRWHWGDLLQACAESSGRSLGVQWADEAWLQAQGVAPWSDLPLWVPAEGDHAAFMQQPSARAEAAGLQTRPLIDTVAATLAWWQALPGDQQAFTRAGLSAEREASLLALWRATRAA